MSQLDDFEAKPRIVQFMLLTVKEFYSISSRLLQFVKK